MSTQLLKHNLDINITDDIDTLIYKFAENNIGSRTVLKELKKEDPANCLLYMMRMSYLGVHGTIIWDIYKNLCESKIIRLMDMIGTYDSNLISYLEDNY